MNIIKAIGDSIKKAIFSREAIMFQQQLQARQARDASFKELRDSIKKGLANENATPETINTLIIKDIEVHEIHYNHKNKDLEETLENKNEVKSSALSINNNTPNSSRLNIDSAKSPSSSINDEEKKTPNSKGSNIDSAKDLVNTTSSLSNIVNEGPKTYKTAKKFFSRFDNNEDGDGGGDCGGE